MYYICTTIGWERPHHELLNLSIFVGDLGADCCGVSSPSWQVGGHEGVGVIVKMGPGTQGAAVKVGDRVGVKWVAHICGSCRKWEPDLGQTTWTFDMYHGRSARGSLRAPELHVMSKTQEADLSTHHIAAACLTGHDGICFNQKISGYYVSLFAPDFRMYQVAQRDECCPLSLWEGRPEARVMFQGAL